MRRTHHLCDSLSGRVITKEELSKGKKKIGMETRGCRKMERGRVREERESF